VLPVFRLPATAFLPWLVPRWRDAWRRRDGRTSVLIGWILLVVLFFSLSPGKRRVYVLPALPAFALAAGPWLGSLLQRRGVQRVGFGLAATIAAVTCAASAYLGLVRSDRLAELGDRYDVTSLGPLLAIAGGAGLVLAALRPARGVLHGLGHWPSSFSSGVSGSTP
jgi:4-amino-4-deoxy-L-arabinose transferase-like glycosyltransferase